MTVKVAINGFGRIGRLVLRAALANKEAMEKFEFVAVNDLTDSKTLAHLLKYDSIHGTSSDEISAREGVLLVNGKEIIVCKEKDPAVLPWKKLCVEIVIESTGKFTEREGASLHLKAGAKKVIISAPAKGEDATIVMGVNEATYNPKAHHILSNASCTTNCLAPVLKVLFDNFGIVKGMMTTIHAYTNDQRILDFEHKDLRRARAAALSMIPTSTGAAKAINLVIPELKGKMDGLAIRVPTPNVSLIDLVAELGKTVTKEEVNNSLKEAAAGRMKKYLEFCELPLVSRDFNGSTKSSIVDGLCTYVVGGNLVKVMAWYDNEWGYSNRVIDLMEYVREKGL